jgi:hypothetical protein
MVMPAGTWAFVPSLPASRGIQLPCCKYAASYSADAPSTPPSHKPAHEPFLVVCLTPSSTPHIIFAMLIRLELDGAGLGGGGGFGASLVSCAN